MEHDPKLGISFRINFVLFSIIFIVSVASLFTLFCLAFHMFHQALFAQFFQGTRLVYPVTVGHI